MRYCRATVFFFVLLWGTAFAEEQVGSSIAAPGTIGITYDEGLGGKIFINNLLAAWLSMGYNVVGADTIGSQPLQKFLVKAGGSISFLNMSDRLKMNAFLEFAEVCKNLQTEGTVIVDDLGNRAHVRYNVWDTRIRIGVLPEWFITEKLSFSYKFGLDYTFHGTRFKVNAAADGVESVKSQHSEFGVFASGLGVPASMFPFYNIGFTWYIGDIF